MSYGEGDYLVREGDGFRRAIMADMDRATNREMFIWCRGKPEYVGRPWPVAETAHAGGEYRVPEGTETLKVKVRCACGVRAVNLRAIAEGVAYLRTLARLAGQSIPPALPVGSWRCPDCKETVMVTAKHLHLAA
jgi:hypothetical protein